MRAPEAASAFSTPHGETPVTWLGVWQEALGVLEDVDRVCGIVTFRGFEVAVPPRELEYLRDLEALTGSRVAILRTDEPSRPLLLRLDKERGSLKEAQQ